MPTHAQLLEAIAARFEQRPSSMRVPPAELEPAHAQLRERLFAGGLALLGRVNGRLAMLARLLFMAIPSGNQRQHAVPHGVADAIARFGALEGALRVVRRKLDATRLELGFCQVPEAKGQ